MANEEHRSCWCGADEPPKLIGSPYDPKGRGFYVACPICGCRSVAKTAASLAWTAWDFGELQRDEENYTIYDMMVET